MKWEVRLSRTEVVDVEAAYVDIAESGALMFYRVPDACEPDRIFRAFADGAWSELRELPQP